MEFSLPFLTREMLKFEHNSRFQLKISSFSRVAGTIIIRGATRSGQFSFKHTLNSNGNENIESLGMNDLPIWVTATISASGAQRGQVYFRCGLAINDDIAVNYMSGYLYDTFALNWPVASVTEPLPNAIGAFTEFTASAVGAGIMPSVSFSPSRLSRIKYATASLTTSAVAGNRRLHFVFTDTLGNSLDFHSSVNHGPSVTRLYTMTPMGGAFSYGDDNDIIIPISNELVGYDEFGASLTCTNLDAGDQINSFVVVAEEFIYASSF
jgi:hypothetical protein